MAMGRRNVEKQGELWIPATQMPHSPGHVFYEKLNELLAEAGFDRWVEIYHADQADTFTLEDTVNAAQMHLHESGSDVEVEDVVADKGYHSNEVLETFAEETPYRTDIPEPKLPAGRKHRWTDKPETQLDRRRRTQSGLPDARPVRHGHSARLAADRGEGFGPLLHPATCPSSALARMDDRQTRSEPSNLIFPNHRKSNAGRRVKPPQQKLDYFDGLLGRGGR